MNELPDSLNRDRSAVIRLCLITAFLVWLFFFAPVNAGNIVYIDIARSGATTPIDTLYSGGSYDFRIWIENDRKLSSLRVSMKNWVNSTPVPEGYPFRGTYFTWQNVGGYGPSGLNTGHACVTVESSSRMYPPAMVWDYGTGFRVWEYDLNEISPDSIGVGGNALNGGLPAGPLQHMVTIHFKATALSLNPVYLHLDSAFVSLGGGMVFVDDEGARITPEVVSESSWTLLARCGDPNGDGQVNVADVVFLIQNVFRGGPAPRPIIVANVNGDEEFNVGDIVYLINYVFNFGPAPDCI